MCGIVACLACDGQSIESIQIKSMAQIISHRGPDDIGTYISKKTCKFCLGHTRLSIVGPKFGHQPISHPKYGSHVVANGEIYNYRSLIDEFGLSTDDLVTRSDSEIIIHGFAKIGPEICNKLIGMFAFVLATDDGDFIAGRDKIGIKPLYMGKTRDDKATIFSSELKAIIDLCDPKDLQTFPAGHYWTPSTGLVRYYKPNWDSNNYIKNMLCGNFENEPPIYSTIEDCKKSLEKAVIDRCMADVEVGLFLSGGLDSSIIGSIMHQPHVKKYLTATGTIKSFAVGQEGSPDIVAARAVSKFLGTDHYEAIFTPEMAFGVLDTIIYHMETYEPELIRSCIPNYFLAKKAREHVKVVITGEGSDELWSGYLYYSDCPNSKLLQEENRRILKAVEYVNLQRCDRMTMANSLEARVPFFDVDYIATAMKVDPEEKLITKEKCEKHFLRSMYKDILPEEVVWRTKAMQCEGVGMTWVQTLQDHIDKNLVSDEDFSNATKRFPNNPPQSKEEYYYRAVFDKYYPNCDKFVHVWPGGCRASGAPWKNTSYTRGGLVDIQVLKKGHGCADLITV